MKKMCLQSMFEAGEIVTSLTMPPKQVKKCHTEMLVLVNLRFYDIIELIKTLQTVAGNC